MPIKQNSRNIENVKQWNLIHRFWHELLATKTRFDRHNKDHFHRIFTFYLKLKKEQASHNNYKIF